MASRSTTSVTPAAGGPTVLINPLARLAATTGSIPLQLHTLFGAMAPGANGERGGIVKSLQLVAANGKALARLLQQPGPSITERGALASAVSAYVSLADATASRAGDPNFHPNTNALTAADDAWRSAMQAVSNVTHTNLLAGLPTILGGSTTTGQRHG